MAAAGGGTPGGIVSIQAIIDQITSVTEGLVAIIDAINASCDYASVAAKVNAAKDNIHNMSHAMTDLFTYISDTLNELGAIDPAAPSQSMQALLTGFDPNVDLTKVDVSKVGILQLTIVLAKVLEAINKIDLPNPVALMFKMWLLRMDFKALSYGMLRLIISARRMVLITESGIGKLIIGSICGLIDLAIQLAIKFHEFAALDTPGPIVMAFKALIMYWDMKILTWFMNKLANFARRNVKVTQILQFVKASALIIGSLGAYVAALNWFIGMDIPGPFMVKLRMRRLAKVTRLLIWGLKEIVRTINRGMSKKQRMKLLMALGNMTLAFILLKITLTQVATTVLLCTLIGILILLLFVPFLLGLVTIVITFGIMVLMIKMMAKVARKAALKAIGVLLSMIILCGVLMLIALTLLVIALVSTVIQDKLLGILITLGFMGLIVLAMLGFMVLASFVAPYVLVGVAAMIVITIGIFAILALIIVLMLITLFAQLLDADATIAAVDKVMMVAEHVIQTILNTDFKRTKEDKSGGWIRSLLGTILGPEALGIFDLMMKVILLFMTVVAVIVLIALVGVLLLITYMYNKNKAAIDQAPEVVTSIIQGAGEIINAILTAGTGNKIGEDDGLFLALVGFVLGQDVVNIFRLLFKVVIIMLTIVVLLMVRVLMSELKWIYDAYQEMGGASFFGPGGGASQMITSIMQGCNEIINAIIHNETAGFDVEGDGLFITLIKFVSPELGTIIQLLFKVLIIAMTMIVLAMLKVVMNELKWIWDSYQELGGEEMLNNVVNMVSNILGAVDKIIKLLASKPKNEPNDPPRSGLQKLLDFIGLHTLADIIGLLCKFVRIGLAILALSVLQSVALIMKDVWDTYQSMGGDAIGTNATKMVEGIGRGINSIIRAMMGIKVDFGKAERRDEGKFQWKVWNVAYNAILDLIDSIFGGGITGLMTLMDAAGNMRAAIPIVTALGAVAEYINRMMKVMETSINGMRTATNTTIPEMISLVGQMVNQINTMEIGDLELCDQNLQKIDETCKKISKTFNNLLGGRQGSMAFVVRNAKNYNAAVNDTDRLINKINGLDIAKMSVLAKMFGNAAAFSQSLNGNFDKLAEVITEKLTPIMEGLQKTIEDADKHIEEYTKRQEEAQNRMAESQSQMAQAQTGFFAQMAQKAGDAAQTAVGAITQTPPQAKPQVERNKDADIAAAIKKALEQVTVKVKT